MTIVLLDGRCIGRVWDVGVRKPGAVVSFSRIHCVRHVFLEGCSVSCPVLG